MKKMTYKDLTPELMQELSACTTAEEIVAACRAKELEIPEKGAKKLLLQFKKAKELSTEQLDKVAGGGQPFTGTKLMKLAVSCEDCVEDECYEDTCSGGDCWEDYHCIHYIYCDPTCPGISLS